MYIIILYSRSGRRRRRRRETFGSSAGRTCAVRGRRLQTAAACLAHGSARAAVATTTRPADDAWTAGGAAPDSIAAVDDVFVFGQLKNNMHIDIKKTERRRAVPTADRRSDSL